MSVKRATILFFATMSAMAFIAAGLYGTGAAGDGKATDGYGISAVSH